MAYSKWSTRHFLLLWVGAMILALALACDGHALYTVQVAESTLWGIPPYTEYFQDWADQISFNVNDSIYFQYDSDKHDVLFVDSAKQLSSCKSNDQNFYDNGGDTFLLLSGPGMYYVMSSMGSGKSSDCKLGMKFSFNVAVNSNNNVSLNLSPPRAPQSLAPQNAPSPGPSQPTTPNTTDDGSPEASADSSFAITNLTIPRKTITTIPWMPQTRPDWFKTILQDSVPVNSYLVFHYTKAENLTVNRVDKAHFDTCDSNFPLETYEFGQTVSLPQPGTYYYIDSNYSLCTNANMRVEVVVPDPQSQRRNRRSTSMSLSVILAATIGSILAIFLLAFGIYRYIHGRKSTRYQRYLVESKAFGTPAEKARVEQNKKLLNQMLSEETRGSSCKVFKLRELEKATDHFSQDNEIGSGAFGTVYKGILTDGLAVAIKRTKNHGATDVEQFVNEVSILSQVNHRNLVKLLGCCVELEVPLLVYEFIANGTLFDHLCLAEQGFSTKLDWPCRFNIALQTADALKYLHCHATPPIFHRDVKTANILLDDDFGAKVADFGLSRFVDVEATHVSTMVKGTPGYLDPEYYYNSQLTEKSDVYSFGVVLLELITSQKPIDLSLPPASQNLVVRSVPLIRKGNARAIIDTLLAKQLSKEDFVIVEGVAQIAAACLVPKRASRPSMSEVVELLRGIQGSNLRAESYYSKQGNETTEMHERLPWRSISGIFRSYQWSVENGDMVPALNNGSIFNDTSSSDSSNSSESGVAYSLRRSDKSAVHPR